MIHWLISWWHAYQRRTDLKILWPICCEQTDSLNQAKAAFAVHALADMAWRELGVPRIIEIIDALEPPRRNHDR